MNVVQESLTDEMAALAEGLKKNAKAMQQSVNKRGSLLEDTDSAIEDGLARAKKSSKESKALKIRYFATSTVPDACFHMSLDESTI